MKDRAEKLLAQFLTYLEDRGETHLRTETALAWATLPAGKDPSGWWASRLTVVRGFATFVHTIDSATEIPPADLLQASARARLLSSGMVAARSSADCRPSRPRW